MRKRILRTAALVVLLALPSSGLLAKTPTKSRHASRPAKPKRPPVSLVWHVETPDGAVVESRGGDVPINPASVVKVATSLWALERLGPDHRFETRFFARGRLRPEAGTLEGDLLVDGDGDPDFQAENAFLVASALNAIGVRKVTGHLVANDRFWMGWENGSAGTERDAAKRGQLMGARLLSALDPSRWSRTTREAWRSFAIRRGLDIGKPARVVVARGARFEPSGPRSGLLVTHRAKPLADTLRRFNCFSNNDIERIGASLGPVEELGALIARLTEAPPDAVRIETTSGLGENRITPRLVVRMMREFRRVAETHGLRVESLLPVAGCDPGTVASFYPQFTSGANATSLVGKTGTLTATDGGTSVLAGFLNTARGEMVFCVVAPRAAGRVRSARRQEEQWLLDLLARKGGPEPRPCAPPLGDSDTAAELVYPAGSISPVAGSAGSPRSRAARSVR